MNPHESLVHRHMLQIVESATAYVPVPWVREQLLRRKGHQLHLVAGIFHNQSILNSFAIAETLLEQDRFDEAEEILRTIIQGRRAVKQPDTVHDKAIEALASIYRIRYYHLFLHDSAALPDNVDAEAPRLLESLVALHLELSDTPSASCLDNLGRVLAWAGLDQDAEQAMTFKMLILRTMDEAGSTEVSFGCCDICNQDIPLEVAYFCRLCESMNVCQRCYKTCSSSSCFPHLIKVAPEQPTDNIAEQIKAWLPPLLDTVRSQNMETGTEGERMSPKRLFSSDDLQTAVRLCEDTEADDRHFIGLISVLHAVLMQSVQTSEFKTLFQAQEGPNVLSTIGLLAMVSNTRSTLAMKYQDAFSCDGFGEWNIPSLLPAEAENLDLEDSEMADEYGHSLAQVASRAIQLARPKHGESLKPTKDIRDSTSDAEKVNTLLNKRGVPQELYGALDLHSNPDAIRLVELLPGTTKDPIRCNLRIESRADEQLSYEALSYVWGNPKPDELMDIELGGQQAPVTPNLHCALSYLRLASSSRLLWIDALCINQTNVPERNDQVAKMAAIYQSASSILIFLGDTENDKKPSENLSYADLFTFLNREVDIFAFGENHHDDEDYKKENEQTRFKQAIRETGVQKIPLLRAFFHLCSREWWNRLWILQEYAIASRDPIFMLGKWQTTGTSLLRDMEMLANQHRRAFTQEETRIRHYNSTPYYPMRQASDVLNCRPARTDGFEYKSWLYPLLISTHSWCIDPRDIIYGRHALMQPVLQELLGPDYSLTTEELYEKVAIWLLMFERGVSMFWDFPVRLSPHLPSWVPDFSKPRQMSDVDVKWEVYEEKLCFDPYPAIFNGEMALYGRPIDTVEEVFVLRPQSADFRADLIRRFWFLDIGLATLGSRYPLWQRHFLSAKLPGMYAEQPLQAWCTSPQSSRDTGSSAFLLDRVTMKMLEEVIHSVVSPVKDKVDREKAIADCMAPIMGNKSSAFNRARDGLERLSLKLGSIKAFLLNTDTTRPDFLGAVFLDFDRLVRSLQHLRTPSLHEPDVIDAPQRRFIKAILQRVRSGTQSGSITHRDENTKGSYTNNSASPFPGLPLPDYGAIQSWIVNDSAFEEEVELFATILLQIARKIKESDCGMFQDTSRDLEQITILDFLEDKKLKDWVVTFNKLRQQYSSRSNTRRSIVPSEGARLFEDRTFFVTTSGLVGVSGNGTQGVAVGDQVIMLDAAPMPIVLRGGKGSDKTRHEIVGYAHMQGLEPSKILDLPEQWWPEQRLFKIV